MSRNASILVIDDEADLRQLVKIVLEFAGYQVETAADGLEGLERLKAFNPDLIVLDMNMPKMGGLEFYQKICDAPHHPRYPVLILTARANVDKLRDDLGIEGLMTKPFEIDELLKKVESIIRKNNGSPETVERQSDI